MTRRVSNAEYAIANMATLMSDYALTMDKRIQDHYDEIARQEEEARRAEEEARLAAEREERERLEAEEAARRAEEEARRAQEEAERAAQQTPPPENEPSAKGNDVPMDSGPLRIIVVALSALVVICCIALIVRLFKSRETDYDEYDEDEYDDDDYDDDFDEDYDEEYDNYKD